MKRYVFPVSKPTCSYVKKSPFFILDLQEFFSTKRETYEFIRYRMFLTRPILSPNSFGALHPQFDMTPMSVTSHSHRRAQLQLYSTSAFLPFLKNFQSRLMYDTSWQLPTRTIWFVRKPYTICSLQEVGIVRLERGGNFLLSQATSGKNCSRAVFWEHTTHLWRKRRNQYHK